ncbi:MAG: hypothetical protein K8S21_00555 [Gemmatimonadetes bacterium]|nr:hypothetical protein [Gemmatimonadota bacterium]
MNACTLIGNATVNITGALTTTAASVLHARSDGSSGFVTFTVATGFTNVGPFGAFVPVSGSDFTILTNTGATTGAFATPTYAALLEAARSTSPTP